jgi:hypothetical protein
MHGREPTPRDGPADPADNPVPASMSVTWQRGESRLFQSVLWDPDSYQRSVELIGLVLEHLRAEGPGSQPLLTADALGPALVEQVLGAADAAVGLDAAGIAQAALAIRYREVVGEQVRWRRLRRIADAQERGETWVTLEESGDPAGNPLLPYRRLEVEVATGRGLVVSASADDTFAASIHRVDQMRVDLADGAMAETAPEIGDGTAEASTYPTAAAREQAARSLRDASPHF